MTNDKVMYFMAAYGKYFPSNQMMFLRDRIQNLDDNQLMMISALEFHDPTVLLIISVLIGTLGIDRFLIGDVGMGVLKLLTGGLCGILTVVDWFLIMNLCREKNMQKLMNFLEYGRQA